MHARRYLAVQAFVAVAVLALLWVWVAVMPMAFLDPEYPAWRAKMDMLQRCDLGQVIVVGDSRAAADVIPAMLPVRTTNLAVGGGEAIEAYVALQQALQCPGKPRRVVISLDAAHFAEPDLFWERSVRFGFVPAEELAVLWHEGRLLRDTSFERPKRDDGLSDRLRGPLAAARFPGLFFDSFIRAGGFLRWSQNETRRRDVMDSRGHYFFGVQHGSDIAAAESHLTAFKPLPVLDWYFDRMLALLAAHGIAADFVPMPVNEATGETVRPEVLAGFRAYLAEYEQRYPEFHVVGEIMPVWPNRYFGDGFSHLNPEGAERFSEGFARWMADRVQGTQTELAVSWSQCTPSFPRCPTLPQPSPPRGAEREGPAHSVGG